MARVGALRRLAQGLRSLGAVGELSSSSAAPASSLLDSLPSTAYSTALGWQPSRRRAGGSAAAAATAASGGTGSARARSQHSGPATAAAAVPPPRRAVYRVEVVTGDVRGAGSPAPAVIRLVGSGALRCPIGNPAGRGFFLYACFLHLLEQQRC